MSDKQKIQEGTYAPGEPQRLHILCPLCEGKEDDCDMCEEGYVDLLEFLRRLHTMQKSLTKVAHVSSDRSE